MIDRYFVKDGRFRIDGLGIEEIAEYLHCSPKSVQRRVSMKAIPFYRPLDRPVFLMSEVKDWVFKSKFKPRRKRRRSRPSAN